MDNSHQINRVLAREKGIYPPHLDNLPEKVLQFGTGILLRGLPDFLIHAANEQGVFQGTIVQVKSTDTGSADEFQTQDNLYHVWERGILDGETVNNVKLVSSISRTLSAKTEWEAILKCAESEHMQVVISNTTEIGLKFNPDSVFDAPPESFPAKLTSLLYHRYIQFKGDYSKGWIIIPCELVSDNGKVLQDLVFQVAKHNRLEKKFIDWLLHANTFCSSLVDRIVTGAVPQSLNQELLEKTNTVDKLAIIAEPYLLWAIEASEDTQAKLGWQHVHPNFVLTSCIGAFKERKLRLLNGAHTAYTALALLAGFHLVRESMQDKVMAKWVKQLMFQEIIPTLPMATLEAEQFTHAVLDRFKNPFVDHKLENITLQYSNKIKNRNLETMKRHFDKFGKWPDLLCLGFAGYLLLLRGEETAAGVLVTLKNGHQFTVQDAQAVVVAKAWQQKQGNAKEVVQAVLQNRELWDFNLNEFHGLPERIHFWLDLLMKMPTAKVLKKSLGAL